MHKAVCTFLCFAGVFLSAVIVEAYPDVASADWTDDNPRTKNSEVKVLSEALARYVMGTIYDRFGETEAAVGEYEKVLKQKKDVPGVYLKLGSDLLLLGEYEKAEEALKSSIEGDPENVRPYLILAIVYTARGDFESAEGQYLEALKHDPDNLKVLMFLSDLYVVQKNLEKAAEVYEKIINTQEEDAFIYFNLGIIYSKLDELKKSEENLKKAIAIDEGYVEAQMVLGFVYEIDGDIGKAVQQYEKVTQIDSLNREAHVRLGQLYYKEGNITKALEQNRVLMRLDPHSADPYFRSFSIFIAEEDYKGAEGILREALRNEISSGIIYASLGFLAVNDQDYAKAVDYYSVASEKSPGEDSYRFYLAAAYDKLGDRKEAIKVLEKIVSKETALPEVYNYLGYLYLEEGRDPDAAIGLIKKALTMEPDNGAYIDSLGWAYFKKGRLTEAKSYVESAIALLPDDAVVREHMGDIYSALGEHDKAIAEWRISFKLDKTNPALEGKIREAKEVGRKKR